MFLSRNPFRNNLMTLSNEGIPIESGRSEMFIWKQQRIRGSVAKWSNAADCKSAVLGLRRFKSFPAHHLSPLRLRSKLRRDRSRQRLVHNICRMPRRSSNACENAAGHFALHFQKYTTIISMRQRVFGLFSLRAWVYSRTLILLSYYL